jgi:hypothetical protein
MEERSNAALRNRIATANTAHIPAAMLGGNAIHGREPARARHYTLASDHGRNFSKRPEKSMFRRLILFVGWVRLTVLSVARNRYRAPFKKRCFACQRGDRVDPTIDRNLVPRNIWVASLPTLPRAAILCAYRCRLPDYEAPGRFQRFSYPQRAEIQAARFQCLPSTTTNLSCMIA